MEKVRKAIIPAAGLGTRSLPITKVLPKEMFPIGGKPAIHYIVEEAIAAGIEEILIVLSRSKTMIMDYFDRSLELEAFLEKKNKSHLLEKIVIPEVKLFYTRQPYARGLGDAILQGKEFVGDEPFAVLLPDDIYLYDQFSPLAELIDLNSATSPNVLALKKVPFEALKKYGVVKNTELSSDVHHITGIVEKPESQPPSDLAVIGRYVLSSDIFSILEKLSPGVGGEIQLTDAIAELIKTQACLGKVISSERFDIGVEDEYVALVQRIHL
ncbi:UTP--glucose-1-phosphate uridylyltransferase [Halalkalibacter alkalisediminis]|uniref:UTP--glucose-1-phosphate uridylyltransferase n=1 Tax=Halalkalibacter alkalisediminis TaxID=935616 RepID=A0ABV6NH37_9BACI|nr:UTP--glucose-1-phosphate uridylyltransferase [Halalkalibacter alkalisediminis]